MWRLVCRVSILSACRTPIHRAVENKNDAVFSILLEHSDIDLELQNSEGDTPLWLALASVPVMAHILAMVMQQNWLQRELQRTLAMNSVVLRPFLSNLVCLVKNRCLLLNACLHLKMFHLKREFQSESHNVI